MLSNLERNINAWLDKNNLRGDARLVSKQEWNERGETLGQDAHLTLVIDGSPMYRLLNHGEPSWDLEAEFRELLERHGYYYELGYAWSVHFYLTQRALELPIKTKIENLQASHEGHAYHGCIELFASYHHVRLLRVKDIGDLIEPADEAPQDVKDWFAEAQNMWEGAYQTVMVPGLPGRYVLLIFPFAI